MCLIPLQARQALGVGPDAFLPSNLDAQAATVNELDVFGPNLRDMLKATQAFADNTNSTCHRAVLATRITKLESVGHAQVDPDDGAQGATGAGCMTVTLHVQTCDVMSVAHCRSRCSESGHGSADQPSSWRASVAGPGVSGPWSRARRLP